MAITGTTNTCEILTNEPFVLSGISESNLSTINIVDKDGLNVAECFGIETRIVKAVGGNITLSGDCDTSLEILITEGVKNEVVCEYTGTTQLSNGLIEFKYPTYTSTNAHPDCCTSLGFTPELGPDNYYVCRWQEEIDPNDCANYIPVDGQNSFDVNGYKIFTFDGQEVTEVPQAQCCYDINLEDEVNPATGEIRCVEPTPYDPCQGLTLIQPVPLTGFATFENQATGQTNIEEVPTAECCQVYSLNFQLNPTGTYSCYNSLTVVKPTVSVTNDSCCEQPDISQGGNIQPVSWTINLVSFSPQFEEIVRITYIDSNGVEQNEVYYGGASSSYVICAQTVTSLFILSDGTNVNQTGIVSIGTYQTEYATVTSNGSVC